MELVRVAAFPMREWRLHPFKEVDMRAVAEFFVPDIYGNPVKRAYTLPVDPIYWPTSPKSILVKVFGDVGQEIIERARALGWGFNPITGTFYRED
jgi:hypothetical protein